MAVSVDERDEHARLRTARIIHGAGVALLVASYPVLPPDLKLVVYPLGGLSTVAAILVGVRLLRPAVRAPWLVLAAAFTIFVLADVLASGHDLVTGDAAPFPWLSDMAYLGFYPVLFGALGLFLRARRQRDASAWLDATIWTVGGLILAWKPLVEPYLLDSTAPFLPYAVAVAYPLLDLGLMLMIVRVVSDRATMRPAGLLLAAGLLCQLVTDVAYGAQNVAGAAVTSSLLDVGWLLSYALVGAAALHPSMTALTRRSDRRADVTHRGRLLGLLAPAFLAPAVLMWELVVGGADGRDAMVVAVTFTVLFVLAAARGAGLVSIADRHASELVTHHDDLQRALADREQHTVALKNALRDNESFIVELKWRADHDTLTGLLSRDHFVLALKQAMAAARPGGRRPSVAFLDLDDFKTINDTLGHEAGDQLLIEVAERITHAVGPDQLVARFGGDEFAVLVLRDVERVADELLVALRAPIVVCEQEIRLEVSIGVTSAHDLRASPGDMLREADVAMYAAKAAGGGWTRYHSTMTSPVLQRLTLRARLMQGLADGEVEPWFQPVVDLRTGHLVGFEALARWCRPLHPPLPPDQWLPWAEETGLIVAVDRTVLRAAVGQLADWRGAFDVPGLDLAVNISGRSLQCAGIEDEVLEVLAEYAVPAERIVLEVTEGVLIDDDRISPRLHRLRAAGVRVALDDFGTGWSSLSNLRRVPVDQLKLDRSFTAELGRGRASEAVPAAIIQLSRALSLGVVAEGVETPEQRHLLLDLGFDRAQGYLFGPAAPAHEVVDLVAGTTVPAEPAFGERRETTPLTVVR